MTLEPDPDGEMFAYVFKTRADPFAGRINLFRVYQGTMTHDTQVINTRTHHKERIGQLLVPQGKEVNHADAFGPGDIGAVAKLKETHAGDWLAARDQPIYDAVDQAARRRSWRSRSSRRPRATRTRSSPPCAACRRRTRRSTCTATTQTGEQIVAGLSQIHVEVIVDRMKRALRRRGRRSSRRACPTRRRSAARAKAHGRHKKQTGGRGQFGDCHIEIEPLAERRLRVRQRDQGRRDPARASSPRSRRACSRRCSRASSPATRSRACACGSSTAPTTRSTRRRWRSRSPARSR